MPNTKASLSEQLGAAAFVILMALVPVLAVPAARMLSVLVPFCALLCIPALFQINWQPYKRNLVMGIVLAAAVIVPACLKSPQPERAANFLFMAITVIISGLTLFMTAQRVEKPRFIILLISIITAFFMILAEYNFNQPFTGALASMQGRGMPYLYVVDRGIIICSLLLWPLVAVYGKQRTLFVLPLLLAVDYFVMKTSSQAAFVGLSAGIAVYLWALRWPVAISRLVRVGTIILFLTAPFIVLLLSQIFADDNVIWSAANAGERLAIWSATTEHILDKPWLGQGIEVGSTLQLVRDHIHPHNGVLQIWLETGLVGVVLALLGLLKMMRQTEGLPAFQAAFVSWLMIFCVGYDIWQPWWIATACVLLVFMSLTRKSLTQKTTPASA